jgi:transposase
MLQMNEVYLIKHMWEKQGKSLREIARQTGFNFRTVQKYAKQQDFSERTKSRRKKDKKLDRFIPTIDRWLEDDLKAPRKQRHTARRIHVRLVEEHGTDFKVSYRTVCNYVSAKKKKHYNEDGYLPLTHFPGSAQVDFGTASYFENGVEKQCKYLVLSFPSSNAYYFQVFKGENQECFLTGLQNIFEHLQGIPQQIVFDNLSAAVNMRDKRRIKNDLFLKFEMHYGFEAVFCNPNAGHEKGHVENKVGYHRRNFMVPPPTINDFTAYNRQAFQLAEADMKRAHYRKKESIEALFIQDKDALMPLPPHRFDVFRLHRVRCDKYGKVHFGTKLYSVTPNYAGAELWLFSTHDEIIIKDDDYNNIITHKRLYGSEKEAMNWLPYLDLIRKRPRALKYVDFFNTLPDNWRQLFDNAGKEEKKEYLQILSEIMTESTLQVAERALTETQNYGVHDPDSLRATYARIVKGNVSTEPFIARNTPDLPEYTIEWSSYGKLMARRVEA